MSGPRGAGGSGAPRQGWLTAFEGVFYRLVIGTYGFARDNDENGNRHTGTVTLFAPLSRRLELHADVPIIQNQRASDSGDSYRTAAGDLHLTPRFMPVTRPEPYDYQLLAGLMKVFSAATLQQRFPIFSPAWAPRYPTILTRCALANVLTDRRLAL